MNLKNEEREPLDEEDFIPPGRQNELGFLIEEESVGSPNSSIDANLGEESMDENLYSIPTPPLDLARHNSSLSGPMTPPLDLARLNSSMSSHLSFEEEVERDMIGDDGSSQLSEFLSPSPSRQSQVSSSLDPISQTQSDLGDADQVEESFPLNPSKGVELAHDVLDEVLLKITTRSDPSGFTDDADGSPPTLVSQSTLPAPSQGELEGLVPLVAVHQPEHPSLTPFPSTASTLLLSPETIPAGSGLSSGRVHSPDREPPVPIARSSPVIHNLKSSREAPKQGDHETSPPGSLAEESGADVGGIAGIRGIDQPRPSTETTKAQNVSLDMFASQEDPEKQVEMEICSQPDDLSQLHSGASHPVDPREQDSGPSCGKLSRQVPVIVGNNPLVTPVIADPAPTAEDPPPVGAKRPRQDGDQVQGPEKAKKRLNFRSKRKRMSKSQRAGLVFPVSRINNRIKEGKYAKRSGVTAGVYMAGVLEYMAAEVVEIAGRIAEGDKRHRITPRHIQLAILGDEEISVLTKGIIIPRGGVIPWVHPSLIGPATSKDCQGKFKAKDDLEDLYQQQ